MWYWDKLIHSCNTFHFIEFLYQLAIWQYCSAVTWTSFEKKIKISLPDTIFAEDLSITVRHILHLEKPVKILN